MKIVIDTNVLISALAKDSISREIISLSGNEFYYPEISLREVEKYKKLIMQKADIDEEQFVGLLNELMEFVKLVSDNMIDGHLEEAGEIMKEIDPDDVVFIACALSLNENCVIWSNDAHVKTLGVVS